MAKPSKDSGKTGTAPANGPNKASDEPLAQTEQAREDAPIGWDTDLQDQPSRVAPETADGDGGRGGGAADDDALDAAPESARDEGHGRGDATARNAGTDTEAVPGGGDAGGGGAIGGTVEARSPGSSDDGVPVVGGVLADDAVPAGRDDANGPAAPGTAAPSLPQPVPSTAGGGGSTVDEDGDDRDGADGGAGPTVARAHYPPMAGGDDVGAAVEDTKISALGQLVEVSRTGGSLVWSVVGPGDGRLGSFDIFSTRGQWVYQLDNDAAQGLKAGDTAQEIFTVRATDRTGAYVDHKVTITVVGTNDEPVIAGTATGAVAEDGEQTVTGALTVTDVDIGDTASWSLVGGGDGAYGSLTLNPGGSWSYALDNDAAQGLKAGDTAQEIFTVRVTDSAGAEATQTVTVTVMGTNDAPVISGTATGTVAEDGGDVATGTLSVTDVDIGDSATWSLVGGGAGTYGSLTLDGTTGQWSYALDNAAAQGLKAGDAAQDIFTVRVTDSAGGTAEQTVTVTILGSNDQPMITGTATGAVAEDGTLTAGGALTAIDLDIGDTATWSLVGNDTGQYGALTLNDDGSWSYALDNAAAQGLKAGDTAQEIFTVRVTDSAGATAEQTVTVTISGTNDVPVISGTATGAVAEDGTQTTSGTLGVTDVDIGDSAAWSLVEGDGAYGTLTLGEDGSWSYALDNAAAQGLKEGDTAQDIFTVQVTDASGASAMQTVTVTVTGTNDVPVISGTATGAVAEDGTQTASGTLGVTDVDIGDSAAWSLAGGGEGAYGTLTLGEDGSWSYALDNAAAQGLKAGDTAQDIFTVRVTDAAGAEATRTIAVTVTGSNDIPVISGTAMGAVQEDETLAASGQLSSSDADIGDTASWSLIGGGGGAYGTLTLDPDGSWSYALDNAAAQGLRAGDSAQEIFTVQVTDASGTSATQTVTVTVTGANDAPLISGTATGSVAEDGAQVASGGLSVTDVDIADSATWTLVGGGTGAYGSLTLNPDGSWSYTLDNDSTATQGLKAGDTVQEIFTVRATDSAGATVEQTVTVTVSGTNDVPVISGTATGAVEEDGTLTASGKLDSGDADIGDTASWSLVGGDGAYGTLTLGEAGSWSYALDNDAAQGLRAGETVQETFTVRVTDAAGGVALQQVTVTVTGTDDVPVISGTATGAVEEDGTQTASGGLSVSDADIGDTATWSLVSGDDGAYGSLTLNPDGSWSYTLDNGAAQGLKAGDTAKDIFTVRVTDAAGATAEQTVTVTVSGTNDLPVISGSATGAVAEDGVQTTSGTLNVTDLDIGDNATWSLVGGAGSYGALTLGPDGSWSYVLDNDNAAAQGLKAGDTAQDIFTVKLTDAAGAEATQTVTVTVSGTNDIPAISGTTTGSVAEDGTLVATGRLSAVDADVGDTATWSLVDGGSGTYGSLTLNADGSWSYTLDNDSAGVQGLKGDETAEDSFTVRVTDSAGATVDRTITIAVQGTNDNPVISGTATGWVKEDHPTRQAVEGSLTATDAEGDSVTWSVEGDTGSTYGAFTVDSDGTWTYTLDNDSDAVQSLGAQDVVYETFTVRATDAQGGTADRLITVEIRGSNDGPYVGQSLNSMGNMKEDGSFTFTAEDLLKGAQVTDVDYDALQVTSVTLDGTGAGGTLTGNQDGSWTYMPGENVSNVTPQFTFTVSDGLETVSAQASVFVEPVADPADVSLDVAVVQEVINTGPAGSTGRVVIPNLTTQALPEFTLEFTVVGESVPVSTGQGPVVVNIGSTSPASNNLLTLWNPANMTVGMTNPNGSHVNIPTGVNLGDGDSHRVTLTWDGTSDTLNVYDNGELVLSTSTPRDFGGNLYMSIAGKANTPPSQNWWGGGWNYGSNFRAGEHFEGTIYNVAMADKAETAEQVSDGPLTQQLPDDLLVDVRAEDGRVVDKTGSHGNDGDLTANTAGGMSTGSTLVDTDLAPVAEGAVLHLDVTATATDPNDPVTVLEIGSFLAGTVVSDGTHSVTVGSTTDKIDVTGWNLNDLTARLPDGVDPENMNLTVIATTTTPSFPTGEVDAQGNPVMDTDSATSEIQNPVLMLGGSWAEESVSAEPPETAAGESTDAGGALSGDDVVVPGTDGGEDTAQTDDRDSPASSAPILTVAIGAGTLIDAAAGGSTEAAVGAGGDTSLGLGIAIPDLNTGQDARTGSAGDAGVGGDLVEGGTGDDVLRGDSDHVTDDNDNDRIIGNAGNDQITGGDGSDVIEGGTGNDRIEADFQWETSGAGDDVVDAGEGDDTVIGGAGDDSIAGGEGDDEIQGDFDWETRGGNDRIDAGGGDDLVIGGAGGDAIAGGPGSDTIYGDYRWSAGSSDDTIAGGEGDDVIYGGGGTNVLVYAGLRSEYRIEQNSDGSYTVTDLVADRDGTDRVYDVATFRFEDGDISSSEVLTNMGSGTAPPAAVIQYPLDIEVMSADGGEALGNILISMAEVPQGTVFSAGAPADGYWVLTQDQLDGLTMTVPAGSPAFDLNVSISAADSDNGDTTTTSVTVEAGASDGEQTAATGAEVAGIDSGDGLAQQLDAPEAAALVGDDDLSGSADETGTDPLQPYRDLAEPLEPGLSATLSQPAPTAQADSATDASAAAEPSPVDSYMALVQAQDGAQNDLAQASDNEDRATADYGRLAGATQTTEEQQAPLSPEEVLATTGDDGAADDTSALPLAQDDASAAVESIPYEPPSTDDENHGL